MTGSGKKGRKKGKLKVAERNDINGKHGGAAVDKEGNNSGKLVGYSSLGGLKASPDGLKGNKGHVLFFLPIPSSPLFSWSSLAVEREKGEMKRNEFFCVLMHASI